MGRSTSRHFSLLAMQSMTQAFQIATDLFLIAFIQIGEREYGRQD